MLLERPRLYSAKVVVNWGTKEFIVGKPAIRIPWKVEKYLGETSKMDKYTSGWSDPKESDSFPSYFINQFTGGTEIDFGFLDPIAKEGDLEILEISALMGKVEDQSLGEVDVPLTSGWIQEIISKGVLPPISLKDVKSEVPWSNIRARMEESNPEWIKSIVSVTDYDITEVETEKTFYLGRTLSVKEKQKYVKLLREYSDVFAWTPTDLKGISPKRGKHHIDLVKGAVPVRQKQYRFNPRYSLIAKKEIDKLLEARFIYPVINSEWVSPIVVVPKVGADGKVKIWVCRDFRKLNAATNKDYFPLSFTDIILDHVSG